MRSGELRHKVTLQQRGQTVDVDGFPNDDSQGWTNVATVWADVDPQTLRAREFLGSAANQTVKIVPIRIRYRADVTEAMRVMYETRVFHIEAVVDVKMRHREMELYCVEVSPGG